MKSSARVSLGRSAKFGVAALAGVLLLLTGSTFAQTPATNEMVAPNLPAAAAAAPQDKPAAIGIVMIEDHGTGGVKLLQVYPGGPAAKAGIQAGDPITQVDSKNVTTTAEMQAMIRARRPGDSLSLNVARAGSQRTFPLRAIRQADLATLPDSQRTIAKSSARSMTAGAAPKRESHFTIEEPSEWEKSRDPFLRARYTRFGSQ